MKVKALIVNLPEDIHKEYKLLMLKKNKSIADDIREYITSELELDKLQVRTKPEGEL